MSDSFSCLTARSGVVQTPSAGSSRINVIDKRVTLSSAVHI